MASAMDVEEQAAKWLIELDAGATPAEWERLTQWLAADPRHRAAYLRLSKAWNQSDALRKLRPLDYRVVDLNVLARASRYLNPQAARLSQWRERFSWRGIGVVVASTLFVAVGIALAWRASPTLATPVHETSFGETQRIALSDGSRVRLNVDSLIRIEFTPTLRNIVLERGEALFEVAPDVRRPFRVTAANTQATAAESRFAVRRGSSQTVDVMVADGPVMFERARSPLYFGTDGVRFTRTLWTGDRARANDLGVVVRKIGVPAVDRLLAWQNGQVAFLGETLEEAVREINRYNRQSLLIGDPEVAHRRVSGTFDATNPRAFVSSLEQPLHVRAERGKDRNIRLVSAEHQR
jgi:transmembrane sensor